ncbi:MAG: ATP-binding protein [Dehalococcoides mccartyi]|uniref:ATP-binding protein n=1 Tax=Dehalococcoides mccartyi TaxID=61435 RepID=UPI0030F55C50
MKNIELPPFAPLLIESTRAIGYSLEAAVADIIDNSISAGATIIKIEYLPFEKPYISIIDNGTGMPDEKLTESMRYGSADPSIMRDSFDMGRYGLGMKTASLSQCKCLTVASKNSSGQINARRWDLDHIKATGNWNLIAFEENEIDSIPLIEQLKDLESGTLVLWQKLDKVFAGELDIEKAMAEKMTSVNKHLSLVFHRFLKGGDATNIVEIFMNEEPVIGFDPFFVAKSRQIMDEEKIEVPQYNSVVLIQPYVLPHISKMSKTELELYGGSEGLRKLQGFYVYRNKRLLIWGTWFKLTKMDEYSKLARVRIDIPNSLDELWTLDVKKSTAIPPEIVKSRLKQIISNITENSRRTYTFRGRRETRDGISHIWNVIETREGVRYELNAEHPIFEKLSEMVDDDAKRLLNDYTYSIASNFPINRLHNDIFNEKKIARDNGDFIFENIKEQLEIFMKVAESQEERRDILERLLISEPFCDFSERLKTLISE